MSEKANNIRRWSGNAVGAPKVQIPIKISASSTDLKQSSSTGQCILTALGPMLILLASENETIPLVCAIVKRLPCSGLLLPLYDLMKGKNRKSSTFFPVRESQN